MGVMSAEFDTTTAVELRQRIVRKYISPVELTQRGLDKAQASQAILNPRRSAQVSRPTLQAQGISILSSTFVQPYSSGAVVARVHFDQ
jgi:hypothetical protein